MVASDQRALDALEVLKAYFLSEDRSREALDAAHRANNTVSTGLWFHGYNRQPAYTEPVKT